MTSRADSLTHDDLQKAEIERLRNEIKELHAQLEFADMAISRFNNGEELQSVLELNNNLRAELNETSRLAYEWMICHDKLKAGEPYTFPSPPYNKTIDDLRAALAEVHLTINALYTERDKARAALAEAREVMKPLANRLALTKPDDMDDLVADFPLWIGLLRRAARWLERNP